MNRPLALLPLLAVLALPNAARAQKSPNSAAAEALFADARKLQARGDEAGACEKFAQSEAIEHALGTLLNVAVCHEKQGRTATAWTEFARARSEAARLPDPQREKFALEHIQALEPRLHRVAIDPPPVSDGLAIDVDQVRLATEAWGAGVPLDPGDHTLVASAPGKVSWTHPFTVTSDPGTEHLAVPLLVDAPPSPSPSPSPSQSPSQSPSPPESPPDSSSRTLALVIGGVGVAALAVSAYTTFRMFSDASDRDSLCSPGVPCPNQPAFAQASQSDSDARTNRTIAIATGLVGVAAVGVGAYLYFRSPSPVARVGVGIVPRVAGADLALRGSW